MTHTVFDEIGKQNNEFFKRAFLPDTTWKWCRDEVYYINVDGMELVLYC